MTKKFKEIILSIQDKSMEDQQEYLENFLERWKGGKPEQNNWMTFF
jgi:hypothetical protein